MAWDDAGHPNGIPILFCHGAPGCRLQRQVFLDEAVLRRQRVRMITIDRPGYGYSDFQGSRSIACWPERDVAAVARRLGLRSFALLAFSSGTPYAIAVAASSLPVTALAVVSGDAPPNRVPDFPHGLPVLASKRPRLTALMLQAIRHLARMAPGFTLNRAAASLSDPDRQVVSQPQIREEFLAMLRDALRQGTEGPLLDLQLANREWKVAQPAGPLPIHVWHGNADPDAPVSVARLLVSELPGATLHLLPGEGHVSVFIHHGEEILKTLAAA